MKRAAVIIVAVWAVLLAFVVALFWAAGEDERSREAWQHGTTNWEDR